MDDNDELAALGAMIREHLLWEAASGHTRLPIHVAQTVPGVHASTNAPLGSNAEEARVETSPVSAGPRAPASPPVLRSPQGPAPDVEASAIEASAIARPTPAERSAPHAGAPGSSSRLDATTWPVADRERALQVLADDAARCTACRLHEGRTKTVFARGSSTAQVAFVGEAPGFHEDAEGVPFVGESGALLDRMVGAMGLGPDEIYICNVVKCRPPENRTPLPDEAAACAPFLARQLEIVAPSMIVALGRSAAESLGCAEPGRSWRGAWGQWRGIPVMPTYHPAYVLRTPEMKRPVWEDLQQVLVKLGRSLPSRKT